MDLNDLYSGHKKESVFQLSTKDFKKHLKSINGKKNENDNLWDAINQINVGKKRIEVGQTYSQFTVNNAMSQHIDTILFAYEMNMSTITDQMHFDYMLHAIKPRKRYGKWASLEEGAEIELVVVLISRYFHINREKSRQYYDKWSNDKINKFKKLVKPMALKDLEEILKKYKKSEITHIRSLVNKW